MAKKEKMDTAEQDGSVQSESMVLPQAEETDLAPVDAPLSELDNVTDETRRLVQDATTESLEAALAQMRNNGELDTSLAFAMRAALNDRSEEERLRREGETRLMIVREFERVRDGFYSTVQVGSMFPVSEELALLKEGAEFKRVKVEVADGQLGVKTFKVTA